MAGVLLAVLLGVFTAAIGFNIQHDGGHHAYSRSRWVNTLTAMTLELLGGSTYLWHWKHDVFHHTYVNIAGHDTDIDLGMLARLSPHQPRRTFHRWQHLYLWVFYGVLAIKWQLIGDFRKSSAGGWATGRSPARGAGTWWSSGGQGRLLHPRLRDPDAVPLGRRRARLLRVVGVVAGILLSLVFQVAHCVEEAEFPLPDADTGRIERALGDPPGGDERELRAGQPRHHVAVGGLNFQIEHHLFPRISHVNYPALSRLVEETCKEFGVRYTAFTSFRAGIASHYRWLRRMGTAGAPDVTATDAGRLALGGRA